MIFGLKGAQRIVFDELRGLLDADEDISVMILANRTNYHHVTVCKTLQDLREMGLVEMRQPKRGAPADYSITEEAKRWI
jgi:predicted transcriptional regulator